MDLLEDVGEALASFGDLNGADAVFGLEDGDLPGIRGRDPGQDLNGDVSSEEELKVG